MKFVAVSSWLARKAAASSLLAGADVTVIPNPFPLSPEMLIQASKPRPQAPDGLTHLIFGAARIDDPIKGLPILLQAMRHLREEHPQRAAGLHLDLFGSIRHPELLQECAIPFTHHGTITDFSRLRNLYARSKAVISSSRFETLPGTLVEGQAYGAIPVAFDRGGQRDIITHRSTGYLADYSSDEATAGARLAEGILWALDQPDNRIRPLMAASVERRFSPAAVASRYLNLLYK